MSATSHLREIIARPGLTIVPAAHDALSAKLIEDAGYEVAFMSGAGISASHIGAPDMGAMSYGEVLACGRAICESVSIPMMGDADTGYGNSSNVRRTVLGLAKAGFAAVMIEDQVFPKRCGFLEGVTVVDRQEAQARMAAAVSARDEAGSTLLIGRTDATGSLGIEEGIARARMFEDMGCDLIYLEGARTRQDLDRFCRAVAAPKLFVAAEGLDEAPPSHAELADMGYAMVVWALSLLNASIHAMQHALVALRENRPIDGFVPLSEINRVLGIDAYLRRLKVAAE